MALPSEGPISGSRINTEFGRQSTSEFQFSRAEGGAYGTLNTASPAKPNGVAPHALSEWYRYDHGAVSCPAAGTYLGSYCSGCTLYYTYADGSCGSYDMSQGVTTTCGPCCGAPPADQLLNSFCEECTEIFEYTDGCYGVYTTEQLDSPNCCEAAVATILTGPYSEPQIGCENPYAEPITVYLWNYTQQKGIACYEYDPSEQTEAYDDSKYTNKLNIYEWYHSADCGRSYYFSAGDIVEYYDC
jgi:hypothetical protein